MSELWGYAREAGEAWIAKGILLPPMQERSVGPAKGWAGNALVLE